MKGRPHRTMERVRELQRGHDDNEKDKGGISISKPDFGMLRVGDEVSRNIFYFYFYFFIFISF
jgi:hypothetical protein